MTTTPDAGDDLLSILDELDELIATARSMPMSASAIVNRDEALDLIDRARQAVPDTVHRAEDIVAGADSVVADGRAESDRLIARAQEEADRLVSNEAVVRAAHERADRIVAAAEDKAARLRAGADQYSDRSLEGLEKELAKIAEQVRRGREALAPRLAEAGDTAEEEPESGSDSGSVASSAARPAQPSPDLQRRFPGWSVDPAGQQD